MTLKKINDTYGHPIGDIALQGVTASITEAIREYDYAFRMGGDEFLIFLPDTKKTEAYSFAERIRASIGNIKLKSHGDNITITCSFGISQCTSKDVNIEVVVGQADEALYAVKKSGKNRVKI